MAVQGFGQVLGEVLHGCGYRHISATLTVWFHQFAPDIRMMQLLSGIWRRPGLDGLLNQDGRKAAQEGIRRAKPAVVAAPN